MKTDHEHCWRMARVLLILIITITLIAGCRTPMQGKKIEHTGFLGDYSRLRPGASGQAQWVYRNPTADFAKYSKIMIDPIGVWAAPKSKLAALPEKNVAAVLSYLDGALRRELSKDYAIVTKPGPDVMRLRIALTEARGAKVVLNTLSSVIPIGLAVSILKLAATGTHSAVGEVNMEAELLDSQTGEQLGAAIDGRAGRKVIASGNFTKWGDVQDAFDFWAERLRLRLEELRRVDGSHT
ncbi:MAG: DUF3313 domain-containing protein [Desulfosalsimonadaceae bacterium]|nr:DUF3313 domain-containing protein [Desulfosalsimonadaceae bacterium]